MTVPDDARIHTPAIARNREAIAEALQTLLPSGASVLEIASGSGEHGAFFASRLLAKTPGQTVQLSWQPTEVTQETFASIEAWASHFATGAVRPPIQLDVTQPLPWPLGQFGALFNANMIHISPWDTCVGLFKGAAHHLHPGGGLLILYGPYKIDGQHTAESNAQFDAALRARDPRWGVRDLEALETLAHSVGMHLRQRMPMPANNQIVVFERR